MDSNIEDALNENLKQQKMIRKKKYTKPELFITIENFMSKKRLICYGGTAINALLPVDKQFYSGDDVPDYDFFSFSAEKHSIELSNLIHSMHYEVEVKSALFEGTYKIYVNSIPIVDISQIDKKLFDSFHRTAIKHQDIYYAPYNYLRLSMYQELSRPLGNLSRWKKVYERLQLLNDAHPFLIRSCNISETNELSEFDKPIFDDIIERMESFVWLGDYSMKYYQPLFPKKYQTPLQNCLYVQVENEADVWKKLKGIKYKTVKHTNKLITFYQVFVRKNCMLYVILTDSCQSFNTIDSHKIASYDTMLCIYYIMSFMIEVKELNINRLLSYCFLLENIKQNDRPVMRRYRMPCNGTEKTYEQVRQDRDKKYIVYKKTGKYRNLFFHYVPKKSTRKSKAESL